MPRRFIVNVDGIIRVERFPKREKKVEPITPSWLLQSMEVNGKVRSEKEYLNALDDYLQDYHELPPLRVHQL